MHIDPNKMAAILRRLKDLGILTRDYAFSDVFQNKILAISQFYGTFAEKPSPIQQALNEANEYLRSKSYSGHFEPRLETEDK